MGVPCRSVCSDQPILIDQTLHIVRAYVMFVVDLVHESPRAAGPRSECTKSTIVDISGSNFNKDSL